jgi:hypothetical protein
MSLTPKKQSDSSKKAAFTMIDGSMTREEQAKGLLSALQKSGQTYDAKVQEKLLKLARDYDHFNSQDPSKIAEQEKRSWERRKKRSRHLKG